MTDISDAIAGVMPGFRPESLSLLGEGMDNVVYRAVAGRASEASGPDEFVFRFPKFDEAAELVESQVCVLPLIAEVVDVEVPEPSHVGRVAPSNHRFYGYRMLRGCWLSEVDETALTTDDHHRIAESLGDFVAQLHAMSPVSARQCGVPDLDVVERYRDDFEKAEKLLFPLVSAELANFVTTHYETYFDDLSQAGFEPTLLHGDLAADHVLVDPQTLAVTGIIDFGDAHIGDPVYEFHQFAEPDRPLWQQLLFEQSPYFLDRAAAAKCRFFYIASFVEDANHGIDNDVPEAVAYGRENLERLLDK